MKTLIFVKRKADADYLKTRLTQDGVKVDAIHGDKPQHAREFALDGFKRGRINVLVATDVASRGLDIPQVGHVINYDMASCIDDHVHRIGRTGRVGHPGLATGFFNESNENIRYDLIRLLQNAGQEIEPWMCESADLKLARSGGGRRDGGGGRGGGRGGGGRHQFSDAVW